MSAHHKPLATAAICVLAQLGSRGFTHRAVDRQAKLPEGTASRYARTRAALLALAADQLFSDDRLTSAKALQAYGPKNSPGLSTVSGVTDALVRVTSAMLKARDHYRARLELQLEAARDPALRGRFVQGRAVFVGDLAALLDDLQVPHPTHRADELVMAIDGVLHRQLVLGSPALPAAQLRRLFASTLEGDAQSPVAIDHSA